MICKFINLLTKIISIFKLNPGLIIFLNILLSKFKINFIIANVGTADLNSFVKKLFIYNTGHNLIRVGKKKDGGYLIPNVLNKINYCFSPGVGLLTSFEDDLKKKKIISFLADGTVNDPSSKNKKYFFIKKNLNNFNDNGNMTLKKWMSDMLLNKKSRSGLILQMDIEGSEISIINDTKNSDLNKFTVMIIEFHYFQSLATKEGLKIYNKIFSKILKNFIIVHIHPNNCCGFSKINSINIPNIMEFTFLNKKMAKYKKLITYNLPHKYDCKNVLNKEDIKLPDYFYKQSKLVNIFKKNNFLN
jgi:hypothetical protein